MDAEHANAFKERQRAEWDSSAQGWQEWWPTIERANQPVADRLIELVDLEPGNRVLDVATGAGGTAFDVAEAVGPDGEVVATDLSPGMLGIAKDRAAEADLTNVTFEVGDAETMELPTGAFDAVLCRFGIMFFPDRALALERIRDALRPGGRFAASVPGSMETAPFMTMPMGVVMETFELAPPPPDVPGMFSVAGEAALRQELEGAGFSDVRTGTVSSVFRLGSPAEYVRFLQDCAGPLTALLADKPPDRVEAVWARIADAAGGFADADGDGLAFPASAALGVGVR